jgi:hypothetical protein
VEGHPELLSGLLLPNIQAAILDILGTHTQHVGLPLPRVSRQGDRPRVLLLDKVAVTVLTHFLYADHYQKCYFRSKFGNEPVTRMEELISLGDRERAFLGTPHTSPRMRLRAFMSARREVWPF